MPTSLPPDDRTTSALDVGRGDDAGALAVLFPRIVAPTLIVVVGMALLRDHAAALHLVARSDPKAWDRAAFVVSIGVAAVVTIGAVRRPPPRWNPLVCLAAAVGLLTGAAWVERPELTTHFWEGFGIAVALVALTIALVVGPVDARVRRSPLLASSLAAVALALAASDAVSLVRDLGDFANAYNNDFVLNEVLAPAAGRVPDATFVPQYTTLYGWIVFPFRHLLSATALANLATILLSCLGIAALVLGAIIARRTVPGRSLWLAVGATVPLAVVTAHHGELSSSIGSLLQELPVRMFPALLYVLFAVRSLVALLRQSVRRTSLVVLGVAAGVIAWNSQDFGVALALAYGIVLQFAGRGVARRRATRLWLTGLVSGLALYPFLAFATGHALKVSYLGVAPRSFAGGFGSLPMQIPGPVMLVFPVLLASACMGLSRLWIGPETLARRPSHQQDALVTLALVGVWSVGCFPYYLNLSSASGQLQTFLLPFGICAVALFGLSRPPPSGGTAPRLLRRAGGVLWRLPIVIPVAVGLAAVLQTPSPSAAIDQLAHPPAAVGFLTTLYDGEVSRAERYVHTHGGGTLGYFGPNANFLRLLVGVKPRILYDDPADFALSRTARRLGCQFMRRHPTTWLVLGPLSDQYVGADVCGIYRPEQLPGEARNTFFELDRTAGRARR